MPPPPKRDQTAAPVVEQLETRREEAQRLSVEVEHANANFKRVNADLAAALDRAEQAQRDAVANAERLRFLDQASHILASSLDYQTTVAAAARLAVPTFADWCAVDVLVDNEIRQLAVSHIDNPALKRVSEARARSSVDPNGPTDLAAVLRTGETRFVPEATDEILSAQGRNPEHRAALLNARVRSGMVIPMIARGRIIGALTMTRLTRRLDQESLVLARELALRAAVAIDNAELYRAALVANEAKANFLATMSHELRTPLTAITGYGELLAEGVSGAVNAAQRQQLDRIKVAAHHLLALIEEILLYARVEAGREVVNRESVQAKAAVAEALAALTPMAHAKQLALTADAIDPTLTLTTDRSLLRRMLINLLTNAVKFTEHGSVTVRAFARASDVVFEVQDTGIGIAPEHRELIFEAFQQVEPTKTRTVEGSGLGLSTTRRLARLLGGDATVESQVHVGSTFRLTLPKEPRDDATRQ